jgi:hypothetical protein
MGETKATAKKATDAKATNAKTTGAKASGAKASGASAKTHTTATPPEGAQATAARTAVAEAGTDGPPRPEIGDGSLDRTPTTTQITAPSAFPNATEKLQEPKFVRHDTPPGVVPGAADPTTIVEEVRIHEAKDLSSDRNAMIQTLRVLAHSQGMNQSVKLGNGRVLTVLQNGDVREDDVPVIPDGTTEKEKPE